MAKYITDIQMSMFPNEEDHLRKNGFTKITKPLNKEKQIYLWYATGEIKPITRIQFSFEDEQEQCLTDAGFSRINKNLRAGGGDREIYLWYLQGNTQYDFPIVELDVTTNPTEDAAKLELKWERSACKVDRDGEGNWIHLWMKREKETYINQLYVTVGQGQDAEMFNQGFIRVDENTNRGAAGKKIFIWYQPIDKAQKGIEGLEVSINKGEEEGLEREKFQKVVTSLNMGSKGDPIYLWYKIGRSNNAIKMVTILNEYEKSKFEEVGATVIKKNLNMGNVGDTQFLCFF